MTQKSLFQSKAELQGGLSSEFATFNLIPQFSCNWVFLQTPSGPLTLSSISLSTTNAIVPFSVHRSNYFLNTAHCGLFKRAVGWINTKLCGRRTSVFKTFMCHFCKEKKKCLHLWICPWILQDPTLQSSENQLDWHCMGFLQPSRLSSEKPFKMVRKKWHLL